MRKLSFFIALIVALQANAQLLNGGFEDWTVLTHTQLDGYETSQDNQIEEDVPLISTSRITGRTGVGYAVKMETHVTPGVDTTFAYIANFKGEPESGEGGVQYTQKPDSFIVWANYDVQPLDTAIALVFLKNNGTVFSMNIYTIVGSSSGLWERKAFKINNPGDFVPDSVIIAFASSNALNEVGIADGSMLMIDDISFHTIDSITSNPIATPEPIFNGDFESWTTKDFYTPDNWVSFNDKEHVYLSSYTGNTVVERTTDKVEGAYALKFTVLGVPEYNWIYEYFANGYNHSQGNEGGFAYTETVGNLTGYYKFLPIITDSVMVNITFLKEGMQIYHTGAKLIPQSAYTQFSIPFDLTMTNIPDSVWIEVRATTQNHPAVNALGNVLYLDNLQMIATPTANSLVNKDEVSIHAKQNMLEIVSPTTGSYQLISLTGQTLYSGLLAAGKNTVAVPLANGVYIVKVLAGDTVVGKKILF